MRVRRPLSVRSKLLASAALVGLLLAAVGAVVHSSFTSTVRNDGNTFQAGTIELSGSVDRATALFDLEDLTPGPVHERCIEVSYAASGDIASSVSIYGESGGALADHLDVVVSRGRFDGEPPADGSCAGFVADEGRPLFLGTLASFPSAWEGSIVDPGGAWTNGDSAAYKISVRLDANDAAQGQTASHSLTFEARSQ